MAKNTKVTSFELSNGWKGTTVWVHRDKNYKDGESKAQNYYGVTPSSAIRVFCAIMQLAGKDGEDAD